MTLTKYTTRCFIAVPGAQQKAANDVCEALVKGGQGTFTVQWPPITDVASVPPVPAYYVCDWQMLPEERTALAAALAAAGVTATFYGRDSWDPVLCVNVTYSTVDTDLKLKTGTLPLRAVAALPNLSVGAKVSLAGLRSKVVLLSWWARLLRFLTRVWAWLTRHR